ncbi:hypothetical protein ACFYT4_30900 [Streptomyces sp. NPDC004609]|uniref:hypothetical protein n=1 Tax=Streptomyces sp. NPDC004609 TaxID=3364704 RepID=UPI003683BC65
MNSQLAVIVGAALGASGALAGSLLSWAGARLQAHTQLRLVHAQQIAQHDAETVSQMRAAHAELILGVDACRREMRMVRRHVQHPHTENGQLEAKRAAVHDRIRESQAAEWVLRLMLSREEQQGVTDLMNAVYASHQALIDDVEEWLSLTSSDGSRSAGDTERYAAAATVLQQQMMEFAKSTHARLYGPRVLEIGSA